MKVKFSVVAQPTFPGVVEVESAAGEVMELSVTFKHQRTDQIERIINEAHQTTYAPDQAKFIMKELVSDWHGVENEKGKVLPFTHKNLTDAILNHPTTGAAILNAWLVGLRGARRGN